MLGGGVDAATLVAVLGTGPESRKGQCIPNPGLRVMVISGSPQEISSRYL